MPEYELQIKQVVDYPRCRIYREFIHRLINDQNIRINGGSGLFHFTVLCSYVNFRTSYRRIGGISDTVSPGEWVCIVKEIVLLVSHPLSSSGTVHAGYLAESALDLLHAAGPWPWSQIKFSTGPATIPHWSTMPHAKRIPFFFLPFSIALELVSSAR